MKVVVTGGCGFVGSATIKALEEQGYEIFNFDLLRGYDVCNRYHLESIVEKGDKILHLAAVSRFDSSDLNPARAFKINVGGTYNVLETAKKNQAERVIFSSTGSVYMPIKKIPINENHIVKGNSVYGCSKAFADNLCSDFSKEMNVIILRYSHLYGKEKNWAGIHNFVNRLKRGLKPVIYGGKQTTDFCYIDDIVQANLLALQTENTGEAYNIGSGEEINICEGVQIIQDLLGTNLEIDFINLRSFDASKFVYDISKARRLLGYKPKFNFRKGIEEYLK